MRGADRPRPARQRPGRASSGGSSAVPGPRLGPRRRRRCRSSTQSAALRARHLGAVQLRAGRPGGLDGGGGDRQLPLAAERRRRLVLADSPARRARAAPAPRDQRAVALGRRVEPVRAEEQRRVPPRTPARGSSRARRVRAARLDDRDRLRRRQPSRPDPGHLRAAAGDRLDGAEVGAGADQHLRRPPRAAGVRLTEVAHRLRRQHRWVTSLAPTRITARSRSLAGPASIWPARSEDWAPTLRERAQVDAAVGLPATPRPGGARGLHARPPPRSRPRWSHRASAILIAGPGRPRPYQPVESGGGRRSALPIARRASVASAAARRTGRAPARTGPRPRMRRRRPACVPQPAFPTLQPYGADAPLRGSRSPSDLRCRPLDYAKSLLDLIGNTPLVRLGRPLDAAVAPRRGRWCWPRSSTSTRAAR